MMNPLEHFIYIAQCNLALDNINFKQFEDRFTEDKLIAIVIALLFVIYFLPIKRALKTFFSTVISPIFMIPISFFYRMTLSRLYILQGRLL